MANYEIPYTLISKDYKGMSQRKYDTLYLKVEDNENLKEKINKILVEIVQNPKQNNISVQVHGVYEIAKEIKLEQYIFYKEK